MVFPVSLTIPAYILLTLANFRPCDSAAGKQNLLDIVLEGYDLDKWPTFQEADLETEQSVPTRANLSLDIMFISSIDVQAMDLTIDFYLNQRWQDARLQYRENLSKRKIVLRTVEQIKRIWTPDTYMVNAKSANFHEVTTPNRLVYIDQNGNVMYSARITAKLACEMHFGMYPVDTQICQLHLASYAYTVHHLKFYWWLDGQDGEPVTYGGTEDLNQFTLVKKWTEECEDAYPDGNYPALKVKFKFQRNFGHHLIQTYLPTVLIVTISWVSFFLEAGAVPARVSLGITTFLTMITLNSGAKIGLPPVSYVKAIDIWMLACTFFVFSTLWQFVWVCVLARRPMPGCPRHSHAGRNQSVHSTADHTRSNHRCHYGSNEAAQHELTKLNPNSNPELNTSHKEPHRRNRSDSILSEPIWILRADIAGQTKEEADELKKELAVKTTTTTIAALPRKKRACRCGCSCFEPSTNSKDRAKKIDLYARWFYPLLFLLFNLVYWGYYLNVKTNIMSEKCK